MMNKIGVVVCAAALAMAGVAEEKGPAAKIDFGVRTGKINKMLHCSSWQVRSNPRGLVKDDDALKPLKLQAWRTHDAPLCNSGQQVVDTHCIFPLMHLDAKDPKNYIFEPTDHLIKLNDDLGMSCFYRLGSSIEHTGDWAYNTRNPKDHAKYAEVLAGIVRHYTQGWGGACCTNITHWELFNEPNIAACWRGSRADMIKLYVTCLKRLKSEFPNIKVGGPAFAGCPLDYMGQILDACKKAGVRPDFVSWHYYGTDVNDIVSQPAKVKAFCEKKGFPDMELVINEWHYIVSWTGVHNGQTPETIRKATEGPAGIKNIDSAAFTMAVLTGFEDTPLTQSYYYGFGLDGSWGYMDKFRQFVKPYYAMKMHGELVTEYVDKVQSKKGWKTVYPFGAWSADGKKAVAIVTDYRGKEESLPIEITGLGDVKRVQAVVLDHTTDQKPVDVAYEGGKLTLKKKDKNSAIFMVTFEM